MTVVELVEQLKRLPPDMRVVVDGYEGGVDDLRTVRTVHLKLNVNSEYYYGAHEAYDPQDSYEGEKYGAPDCEAVRLS